MSRQVPVTISSESDSPIAVTITSASDSAQTISSESQNPEIAMVGETITIPEEDDERSDTIQHLDSSSDELEILEAEAASATARREEQEALERLAKAKRTSSLRSGRSSRSAISSEPLQAPQASEVPRAPQATAVLRTPQAPTVARSPMAAPTPQAPAAATPPHQPELPERERTAQSWFDRPVSQVVSDWFARETAAVSVQERIALLERGSAQSEHGSDHDRGAGVQRFLLDEDEAELQAVRARVRELERLNAHASRLELERRGSRASFESVLSRDPPPGLPDPAAQPRPHPRPQLGMGMGTRPPSETANIQLYPATQADIDRGFTGPFSATERSMLDALHGQSAHASDAGHEQHAHASDAGPPPDGDPGDSSSSSSSSGSGDARKRKKKKKKKGFKKPYAVKSAAMPLPQFPNALTFLAWRRSVRTAIVSCCERPERARAFAFTCEDPAATFETLAITDSDRHRALDAKLADALQKIVRGDLARRLAVRSEALARDGRVLAGRQILFTIYKEFSKDAHLTDCTSYSHLEKMQGAKEIKNLETFLAVWDNLMLNFQTPPKPDHMYSAFLSKIRNIPELERFLKKMNRLSWDDPKKSYESLREECDFLIEEARQEKQSKQIDQIYENGSAANALAASTALPATPEEKKKLPCFYLRDGKPCPNGAGCAYSHQKDVIDKAKKAKEAAPAGGKGKGKGKDKGQKGKGKGKGKGKICHFFNTDKGCNMGSACQMLHEAPAMAAKVDQTPAKATPKAKAAAAAKAAADAGPPKA